MAGDDLPMLLDGLRSALGEVVDHPDWVALDEPSEVPAGSGEEEPERGAGPGSAGSRGAVGPSGSHAASSEPDRPGTELAPGSPSPLEPATRHARRRYEARWLLRDTLTSPADRRSGAISAIRAAGAAHGFEEPVIIVDRPGEIQLVAQRADGARYEVGSARYTTVWAYSGVHEPAQARSGGE